MTLKSLPPRLNIVRVSEVWAVSQFGGCVFPLLKDFQAWNSLKCAPLTCAVHYQRESERRERETEWMRAHRNHKYTRNQLLVNSECLFVVLYMAFFLAGSQSPISLLTFYLYFFRSTFSPLCCWSRSFLYICIVIVQLAITRRRVLLESNEKAHFWCDSNSTGCRCMKLAYLIRMLLTFKKVVDVLIWIIYIKASTMVKNHIIEINKSSASSSMLTPSRFVCLELCTWLPVLVSAHKTNLVERLVVKHLIRCWVFACGIITMDLLYTWENNNNNRRTNATLKEV